MGGSWSRKIKIAIVSYMGHDLRMVDASWRGLIEAFEGDLLAPVAGFSVRREASPATSPPVCEATPLFCTYDMSALPLAYPFKCSGALQSPLELSGVPLSLVDAEVVVGMTGSLEERDDGKST
jgi:hypothetical protein